MQVIVSTVLRTPFANLLAGATEKGICMLEFTETQRLVSQLSRLEKIFSCSVEEGNSCFFKRLNEELDAYFDGRLQAFTIPLDIRGTPFQVRVWRALLDIPYAQTRSYWQQAQIIKKPKAFRAVATANRSNRISIIIPCHRVIAKNGSLAGYGGGLERKSFLLALEKKTNTIT